MSESGRSLFCITGSFSMSTKSSWWSSGMLYEIELASNRAIRIHTPDPKLDYQLLGLAAIGDDELILLSTRSLRRFARAGGEWTEGKPLRLAHARTLSVGPVEGRTIALVTKHDAKSGARSALVVSVERERFTTQGEILEPVLSASVAGGDALVRLASGWHHVELGVGASEGKRSSAKKAAETPAALTLVFGERSSPPSLPDPVADRIGSRSGPLETRVCHGGVFAGIRESSTVPRLITMRDAEVIMDVEAKDVLRFDVTDAGRHAFVIERTDTKRIPRA